MCLGYLNLWLTYVIFYPTIRTLWVVYYITKKGAVWHWWDIYSKWNSFEIHGLITSNLLISYLYINTIEMASVRSCDIFILSQVYGAEICL